MNTIKHLHRTSDRYTLVLLNGLLHRGYLIGMLPQHFGHIFHNEVEGTDSWSKPVGKGITYIDDNYFTKGW